MMKKVFLFLLVFILILTLTNIANSTNYTSDQILNKVLDTDKLKISGTITSDTSSISFTNSVFKRYTLSPNVDSGTNLSFGVEVKKWTVINLGDTVPVYIKFDSAAAITDFKVPATASIYGNSLVTNIHVIAIDTGEVETIGLY
jgi:hypothetical protein